MSNRTIYCTYKQYGVIKRGVLSEIQYEKYKKDPSISDLQPHASQSNMDTYYCEATGKPISNKQILFG